MILHGTSRSAQRSCFYLCSNETFSGKRGLGCINSTIGLRYFILKIVLSQLRFCFNEFVVLIKLIIMQYLNKIK